MEIEKNIAFFINQQFPDIYRQDGPELVQLVKDYYKFLENESNQTHYVSRRMFEYKDIDTTLKEMLIFFQKKYLVDLPLRENIVPFLVKNILDLYRRKGTPGGIELFFSIFFNEYDIEINYPASKMLKVSNSNWRRGVYLQLFPNNNFFISPSGKTYTYADLISKNILGSSSKARAAVGRINYINVYGSKLPIIYIDSPQGNFERYDDIMVNIDGEEVIFGRVNGSLSAFNVDEGTNESVIRTTGNRVGDVYNVVSDTGIGGKAIVTEVSDNVSGEIVYDIDYGGYGYSVENTRLLVSDQTIILNNPGLDFVPYERLRDTSGNEGIVIGQTLSAVGVLMNSGDEFNFFRDISTLDRSPNITLNVQGVPAKNSTSPGILFPDGGDPLTNVIVDQLSNETNVDVFTDVISPFLSVTLDAADYETAASMTGTASPVNINTPLEDAFDIQSLTIGKIESFANINPGSGYEFDVFARAQDSAVKSLDLRNKIIGLASAGDAGIFSIGEIVTEDVTDLRGEVRVVDTNNGSITITPFTDYGFDGSNDIIRSNGDTFSIRSVEIDLDSDPYGDNANINTTTEFAVGRIQKVSIQNSGFGYVDGALNATLVDDNGVAKASGTIEAKTQGYTEGYWADYTSHVNGYIAKQIDGLTPILPTEAFSLETLKVAVGLTPSPSDFEIWGETIASDGFAYLDINKSGSITSADSFDFLKLSVGTADADKKERWDNIIAPSLKQQLWYDANSRLYIFVQEYEYYNSGMRIQDSDFYQEYSYQIKSSLDKSLYEKTLKETVHLAGTKMFGDFVYKIEIPSTSKARFIRFFNDNGRGTPLDIANVNILEASVTNFTVDSTFVTADHEPI